MNITRRADVENLDVVLVQNWIRGMKKNDFISY